MTSSETLPETILQFGAGRFLRAFVDRFVQHANDAGQNIGRVVIVQSTAGQRADLLNAQPDGYNVLVRGYAEGKLVDRVEPVRSVKRALLADRQWPEILTIAGSPDLKYIVTNATEAGYALVDEDLPESAPPKSMPAKLTRVLWQRFQEHAEPVTLLPCELIEGNAHRLHDIVCALAKKWWLPDAFIGWMTADCQWLDNLVDCIVTPGPTDHPLSATDRLLISAEPYSLWAIQRPTGSAARIFEHPSIQVVDDLMPFYLRKVRILNGLHTAMAAKFRPAGFETVLQVLSDASAEKWLKTLCYEEIVPTIAGRAAEADRFAEETFDRLRNPFLAHKLADIAANHEAKVKVRLAPTRQEYEQQFGRPPRLLAEVLG